MKRAIRFIIYIIGIFVIFGPLSSLMIWSFAKKWYWPAMLPQEYSGLYWAKIGDTAILQALTTSIVIASLTTILALLLTIPFAYQLVRQKIPAKTGLMLLFLLPQAFPQLPIFINTMVVFYKWDLVGTITGVVLVHLAGGLIYSLWIGFGVSVDSAELGTGCL